MKLMQEELVQVNWLRYLCNNLLDIRRNVFLVPFHLKCPKKKCQQSVHKSALSLISKNYFNGFSPGKC